MQRANQDPETTALYAEKLGLRFGLVKQGEALIADVWTPDFHTSKSSGFIFSAPIWPNNYCWGWLYSYELDLVINAALEART